jgi:hypothetical protein
MKSQNQYAPQRLQKSRTSSLGSTFLKCHTIATAGLSRTQLKEFKIHRIQLTRTSVWRDTSHYCQHTTFTLLIYYTIWAYLLQKHTFAFFLMCFRSGRTACGPGCARMPCENLFMGGRWKLRSLIGPMWVCTKGARSSTTGVECWMRLPPPTLSRSEDSEDRGM